MSVSASSKDGICVLSVKGDFDGSAAQKLRDLAERALEEDRRDFVVNLCEAGTVNSEGLEALTWLRRESEDQLGMVKLCRVPDLIKEVLLVTRLNTKFEQLDQIDQALSSFS